MFLSPTITNAMADHVLGYVKRRGRAHISEINTELVREFELPTDLSESEFKRVIRKAKDRGHLREPAIALLPQKAENGRSFKGWWTIRPTELDALASAELHVRQEASRAARAARGFLIVGDGNPDLEQFLKVVLVFRNAAEMVLDERLGVVRSDEHRNARLAETMRLLAELS